MSEQPQKPAQTLTFGLFPLNGQNPQPDHLPRRGDLCPNCGQGRLDYNGLLELACEHCGFVLSGSAGGCT